MCGIVDAQVAHEVFGPELSPAGREFYEWVDKAHGRLVVGGKLLEDSKRDRRDSGSGRSRRSSPA